MDNLNRSADRGQRPCTTPERMKLIESIKKSIHRSIEKINPAEYKNVLKGQYIYIHLCHKGQIINSQYTKVALFLGGVVLKKASEKVSVVITNQSSNKIVKKLSAMGKPVLSVLWLQACFQQKRKVPNQDFFFQQQAYDHQNDDQKQEEVSVNFDPLLNLYKSRFNHISQQFALSHNTRCLRFIEKKQKIDLTKNHIIEIHQIDIGKYLPDNNQRRKSQAISEKNPKKKVNKKVQFKSAGSLKQSFENNLGQFRLKKTESDNDLDYGKKNKQSHDQVQQRKENQENNQRLNKNICQKYLKDFHKYKQTVKTIQEPPLQAAINFQQMETPCFMGFAQQTKISHQQFKQNIQTPPRAIYQQKDQVFKTYSIKKAPNKIRLSITNPLIAQRISKLNDNRQNQNLPLIEIAGSDNKNLVWVISQDCKVDVILALISKPKIIVNQQFINALESNPLLEINEAMLKQYQVKCRLNLKEIEGKKIVLVDSLFGMPLLQKIIKQCKGEIVSKNDYLLKNYKPDFVITNKKYFKSNKQEGKVLLQAKFLENLIQFYK